MPRRRRAVVAAAATPVLFALALLAAGYPPVDAETRAADPAVAVGVTLVVYVLPLALLGALAVAARDRGLLAPAVVAVLGLLAAPLLGLPWDAAVPDFGIYAVLALVAACALATVEWALRDPAAARRVVPPPVAAVAVLAGVAHAAVLLGVGARWYTWDPTPLLVLWVLPGLVVLLAVPTLALLRVGLLSPAVVAVAASANSLWVEATTATPGDPLGIYVVAWPLVLGVSLLVGGVEYAVRRRLGLVPPRLGLAR